MVMMVTDRTAVESIAVAAVAGKEEVQRTALEPVRMVPVVGSQKNRRSERLETGRSAVEMLETG